MGGTWPLCLHDNRSTFPDTIQGASGQQMPMRGGRPSLRCAGRPSLCKPRPTPPLPAPALSVACTPLLTDSDFTTLAHTADPRWAILPATLRSLGPWNKFLTFFRPPSFLSSLFLNLFGKDTFYFSCGCFLTRRPCCRILCWSPHTRRRWPSVKSTDHLQWGCPGGHRPFSARANVMC